MDFLQGDYKKIKDFCNGLFADDYFEFEFSYVSEDYKFKEIDRFLWESRHECTRYKNRYEGNIVIGLNEWNQNEPNKYFDAFMYFLKDNSVFTHTCVFFVEDYASESLKTAVKKYFDITVKELSFESKENKMPKKIGFCIDFEKREKSNV